MLKAFPALLFDRRRSSRVLLRRDLLPLAFPILIEQACVVLMGMVSTMLVSHLGKAEMAAVGLTDNLSNLLLSLFSAVALGAAVLVAFSLGRGDLDRAREGSRQSLVLAVLGSLLVLLLVYGLGEPLVAVIALGAEPEVQAQALTYLRWVAWGYPCIAVCLVGCGALRGAGNTRLPMLINIMMNLLNLVLGYVLIHGLRLPGWSWPGLGIGGAALAITLARLLGAVTVLWALARSRELGLSWRRYFRPLQGVVLKDVFSIGIPASVESLMFNVGKLVTQLFIAGMGTAAIAANFITFSILLLVNLPGNALGAAATLIVGRRLGQGRRRLAVRQLGQIFRLSNGLLCLLGLLTVPLAPALAGLYSRDPEVVAIVVQLVLLNALFTPVWSASFVLPAGLKGARDGAFTMWVAIGGMWGCRIGVGYVLGVVLGLGVTGVWLGMFSDWMIRGACYYWRLKSGRWLPEEER
ncbi:EmmdR/YeeO family multidrug/toxin efflux MATE transporter [Zobellella denitrificans]